MKFLLQDAGVTDRQEGNRIDTDGCGTWEKGFIIEMPFIMKYALNTKGSCMLKGVQEKLFFFTIHCNPSLAYIA